MNHAWRIENFCTSEFLHYTLQICALQFWCHKKSVKRRQIRCDKKSSHKLKESQLSKKKCSAQTTTLFSLAFTRRFSQKVTPITYSRILILQSNPIWVEGQKQELFLWYTRQQQLNTERKSGDWRFSRNCKW